MKIKNSFSVYGIMLLSTFFIFINSCDKNLTLCLLTTIDINAINESTATTGGIITSDGGAPVTSRGVCWSTNSSPTIELITKTDEGTGTGSFESSISGLTSNTKYYLRAYATNSVGTAYGNEVSFVTSIHTPVAPTLNTSTITSVTLTTATCGGNISIDGGAPIIARGVCWSTSSNPTIDLLTKTNDGTGTGSFISSITGLLANTSYNVRAYATNISGTAYGTEQVFKTYTGTVIDIEGNVYNTVTIGTQVWIAENLETTKYNDNTGIPNITDDVEWIGLTTPAYCWYNNSADIYKATYGALYNWYTIDPASNGGKNICPVGWHVPTNAEWIDLINSLNGESEAGEKMKEVGTTHWNTPNTSASNSSGFTALPGGYRLNQDGVFYDLGNYGGWWSITAGDATNAWYCYLINVDGSVGNFSDSKLNGISIRCIQD